MLFTAGVKRPNSSRLNWAVSAFEPAEWLVTYQPISTTTYCQPEFFRCSAIHFAFARASASLTDSPKESQLFQPIGGVAAIPAGEPGGACADGPRPAPAPPSLSRRRSEVHSARPPSPPH